MSTRLFGVLRIGRVEVALDSSALREVVMAPETLVPLPGAPAWSAGTFMLRGRPVTVIDLARLLDVVDTDATTDRPRAHQIAIVGHDGLRFGLRIDEARDIVSAGPDQWHGLDRAGQPASPLTPALLARPGQDAAYVLDLDRLVALDGMVGVSEPATAASENTPLANARFQRRDRALLIGVDALCLALDTAVVREIVPGASLTPPTVSVPGYLGAQYLRGRSVPVFDPRTLLGLPAVEAPTERIVVLEAPCGPVALAVSQVLSMVDYEPTKRVHLPRSIQATMHVNDLLHSTAIGESLFIDHESLFADPLLRALPDLHRRLGPVAEGDASGTADQWQRFAFLDFTAGGRYTAPLDELDAVAPYPAAISPLAASASFSGLFRYRNRAVALVDLRVLLGHAAEQPAAQVLIVHVGDDTVGFAIDASRDIEYFEGPADTRRDRWYRGHDSNAPPVERCKCLITIGVPARQYVRSVLRLRTLARALLDAAERDFVA